MYLTKREEKMLAGEEGRAVKKSMEILVALGRIFGADKLIDISSVQVAGVSYHNLGDAGLEYLNELAKDGRVKNNITATLNPAGMDLKDWKKLGIPDRFAAKQMQVIDSFRKLGLEITCTCTPYFIGNKPKPGEHIAWSESSAVAYANSVLGARTNREGGPSSLASALTGKTANYGLHLDENRKAEVLVNIGSGVELRTVADFGALGHAISRKVKNKVLYIKGIKKASVEQLKAFCASTATYGGTALFYMENATPEYESAGVPKDNVAIEKRDIKESYDFLNDDCEPDFVSVGCPHASLKELEKIASLLKGKKVKKEFWIAVSRPIKELAASKGYVKVIEDAGAKLACDTCMAVAPLKGRFRCLATNSAKACYYGRGANGFKTRFCSLEECVKLAVR